MVNWDKSRNLVPAVRLTVKLFVPQYLALSLKPIISPIPAQLDQRPCWSSRAMCNAIVRVVGPAGLKFPPIACAHNARTRGWGRVAGGSGRTLAAHEAHPLRTQRSNAFRRANKANRGTEAASRAAVGSSRSNTFGWMIRARTSASRSRSPVDRRAIGQLFASSGSPRFVKAHQTLIGIEVGNRAQQQGLTCAGWSLDGDTLARRQGE